MLLDADVPVRVVAGRLDQDPAVLCATCTKHAMNFMLRSLGGGATYSLGDVKSGKNYSSW
jgi:hypothetical protein